MTGKRAAEIIDQAFGGYYSEWSGTMTKAEIDEFKEVCDMAMKAVSEEAIPYQWIVEYLAWLESMDADVAWGDARAIKVMLAKWDTEQRHSGCGPDYCEIGGDHK